MEIAIVNPILRTPNMTSAFGVEGPTVLSEEELRLATISELGRALADQGHHVTIYAADAYLESEEVALSDRVTVVGVPTRLRTVFNPAAVAFAPGLGALLRQRGADVIQSGDYFQLTTLFSSQAAASMGVAFVIWQEPFRPMRSPGNWYERGFERVAGPGMRARTRCFVPRTIRARAYLERLGVSPGRISGWIPNGVDGRVFRARPGTRRPEDFGLAADLPVAVVVARLSRQKGVDLAVRAVAILRRRGRDVGLLVRGNGPERGRLEGLVRAEGVSDLVRFVPRGSREDLVDLYNSCDLAIVPSRRDLLPYALIEAGACGLPAVAADGGCMDDFVLDGENGLVVPPDSPEAIADGVRRLLEDEALRSRMGAAAARRFREHFELRVTASRFSRLYSELLDGHSAGPPATA